MNRYILLITLQFIAFHLSGQSVNIHQLHSEELNNSLDQGKVTLLDVRTRGEYANGHITGAGQLNYYALDFKQKLLLLPKDQPVFLYCNTGYRSQRAAEILTGNGYQHIYNLEHGIMEWDLHDLPVVVEPDARPDIENRMEPDEFTALIRSENPVFIDFYAPWCGPCRQMMPLIDSLGAQYRDQIQVVKINVDASKRLSKELKLAGVPYLVLYRKGEKLFEHHGIIEIEQLTKLFIRQVKS